MTTPYLPKPELYKLDTKQCNEDDSIDIPKTNFPIPEPVPKQTEAPVEAKYKSPYEKAGIISLINFWWVTPYVDMINKFKGDIKMENIPNSGSTEVAEYYEKRVQAQYDKWKKNNPGKKPKLFLPAMLGLRRYIIPLFIFIGLFVVTRILYGFFLNKTIAAFSDPTSSTKTIYLWALGMIICTIFCYFFHAHSFFCSAKSGVQIKAAIVLMLYKKINRVSLYSLQQISIGKVVNLAANDVNLFDMGLYFVCVLWMIPPIYIGSTILLWSFFGPVCLVGVGFIILLQPLNTVITRFSKSARMMKNKATDERVKLTNEAVDSIRLLKMYGWDLKFRDFIKAIRQKEIKLIKKIAYNDFLKNALALSSAAVGSFLIFLVYTQTDHILTSDKVFPTIFVCNFLRLQGGSFMATGFNLLMDGSLFFERVVQILELPESDSKKIEEPKDSNNSLEYDNYNGYWDGKLANMSNQAKQAQDTKESKPCLANLNIQLKKGNLLAIVGKIGSGKTSLLLSIAGEIPYATGSLRYKGRIAYVEQEPMIFSSSLRENILFGNTYEPEFYQQVVEGCCLVDDMKLFAAGDMTEIGEKGINLSGGQKARVSLARAIYSRSDIYLLDDPLSAVDAKVAKKLYENAIQGLLKGKTVLLATHQVHFVKNVDRMIVMDQGKIIGDGNYAELKAQGIEVEKIFVESKNARKHSNAGNVSEIRTDGNNTTLGIEEAEEEEEVKEVIEDRGKLFANEDTSSGVVTRKTYLDYLGSSFGICSFFFFVCTVLGTELLNIAYNRIIGYWGQGSLTDREAIMICGILAGCIVLSSILRSNTWARFSLTGAEGVHNTMLNALIRSPTVFFDSNPVGRILNRFSNDIGMVDKLLNWTFYDTFEGIVYLSTLIIVVWIVSPWVTIPSVFGVCLYVTVVKYCVKAIKTMKRIELVSRSPIYSLFSMTLSGLITVRSYSQSENFVKSFSKNLNENMKASYYFQYVTRILGLRLDQSSSIYVIVGLIIIVAVRDGDAGLNGFALLYLVSVSEYLQWIIRQLINTDMLMSSTARVINYTKLKPEAEITLPGDAKLKEANWPQKGEVHFNKVYMRYRENLDHVVKGLDIQISPGEKIGCVGRTGAGKSSIIQMLFRTVEIDQSQGHENSNITIDGVDIKTVGLHALRHSISIIPQTPVVFSGTIKRNLDPLGQHSEEELWNCLEEVGLKKYVDSLKDKLNTDMTNATSVFSVGQKQLVCLARAILKKNKIIVLDEATANVDFQTDAFIQKKIMEKFSDATVFTIAHRLSTIANYDRVLVLDKGICMEFDAPYKLLVKNVGDTEITNTEGLFASMVMNTGAKNSHYIFELCKNSYKKKYPDVQF